MNNTLPVINLVYGVYKNITEINQNLTKRWLYSLGMSLENSVLDCMEILIMAKNAPKPMKAGYLIKASSKLEVSRLKLRLFLELKLVNETRIFQVQAKMEEFGRMLGGWIKSINNQ